jgi:large subunit ribosomal protein L5
MNFIKHFFIYKLNYNLINKFFYTNIKKLPKIKKIVLSFKCKTTDIKNLTSSALILELISNQKSTLTFTKKSNIAIKLKKGTPVGCKITLRNIKLFNFIEQILIEIFPLIKNFNGLITKISNNNFSFTLKSSNILHDNEIKKHYYLFHFLPQLINITIIFNKVNEKELIFILKSIKLPLI